MNIKEHTRTDDIRKFVSAGQRISLTDLTRSKSWREELTDHDIMEVIDRSETTAFLLSPSKLRALVGEIDLLEDELERTQIELERAQIDLLFATRQQMSDWSSGESLAAKAKAHLDSKEALLRRIPNDNQ